MCGGCENAAMRSIQKSLSAGSSPASPSAAGSAGSILSIGSSGPLPFLWSGRLDSLDRVGRFDFVYLVGWLGGLGVFGRFGRQRAVDSVRLLLPVDPGLAGSQRHRFAGAPEGMTRGK